MKDVGTEIIKKKNVQATQATVGLKRTYSPSLPVHCSLDGATNVQFWDNKIS
jgi:hypothetical protein